jgi:ferredoxin-NADP reductase
VLNEGVRKRFTRQLTIYHAAKTTLERAFYGDMRAAEAASGGKIRYISIIGEMKDTDREGYDLNAIGRITPDLIRQTLNYDDHDFYLCGPPAFMQAIYDQLRTLGASDARIFAESFGPSTLIRSTQVAKPEADMAVIQFETTGFEQRWEKGDGTILETAEAHGLSPAFSCRSGSCGSCAVKKLAGDVTYRTPITATHADDEVLICCAVPADGTDTLILDL